jgi:hypothetical protein
MTRPFPTGFSNFPTTVEPQRRLVGGRFGWAVHRFPIKGGITSLEAARISFAEGLARASSWPAVRGNGCLTQN